MLLRYNDITDRKIFPLLLIQSSARSFALRSPDNEINSNEMKLKIPQWNDSTEVNYFHFTFPWQRHDGNKNEIENVQD